MAEKQISFRLSSKFDEKYGHANTPTCPILQTLVSILTPLFPCRIAISSRNRPVVELLLDRGADVNTLYAVENAPRKQISPSTMSPLIVAAQVGDTELVDLLISKGADMKKSPVLIGAIASPYKQADRRATVEHLLKKDETQNDFFINTVEYDFNKDLYNEFKEYMDPEDQWGNALHAASDLSGDIRDQLVDLLKKHGGREDIPRKDLEGRDIGHSTILDPQD
jgi:hypothetical protein